MTKQNEPRRNKTKEELVDEIKVKQEIERQRVLVATTIFPALHDSCKNIADVKVLMEYTQSMLQQIALKKMYQMRMTEVNLVSMMTDDEKSDKYKGFFSAFDSLDVGQSITILDQMKNGIHNFSEEKVDSTPLSEVNIQEIVEKYNQK